MKTLELYFESLLDNDDDFYDPENDKKVIEDWIKDNYNFSGKLTISDDLVVDCDKYVYVKNRYITSLTNGLFRWGYVGDGFNCSYCKNITSLEGAPEKDKGNFHCTNCDNLSSLEGAPKVVGGVFYCDSCDNLTSLKGAPEKVSGGFHCNYCSNLKSLEGAPKKVGGGFYCKSCGNLKSLKGAPEKVRDYFDCRDCDNLKITDSDRKKYKIKY